MKKLPRIGQYINHVTYGRCLVLDREINKCNRTSLYIRDKKKKVYKVNKESITYIFGIDNICLDI